MHFVGLAEMAAAGSNASGLGVITGLAQGTPEKLANEIARHREMPHKPFGMKMTFLPSVRPPDYPGLFKVIRKCTAVRQALEAERIGCDAIPADRFESGGHPGLIHNVPTVQELMDRIMSEAAPIINQRLTEFQAGRESAAGGRCQVRTEMTYIGLVSEKPGD